MKKKFSAVVALGLAFGFAFSAGCSKDPATPPETPFNPADFSTAKTEDDIYTAVKYGIDEFGKYTGAITVEYNISSTSSSSESENKTVISYDPTAKSFYMLQDYKRTYKVGETTTTETRGSVGKFYKDGEQYYGYSKNTSKVGDADAQTIEYRYKITEAFLVSTWENMKDNYANVEEIKEQIPNYEFSKIKSAYETVYAEQLEIQKAKDANAKATATVTATNTNGTLETKIVTSTETTENSVLTKGNMEQKMVAKDGKIIEVYQNGSVETEKKQTMTQSYKFTYAFDKTAFDAVNVGDMSTAIEMPDDDEGEEESEKIEVKMTAVVGDWSMEFDRSYEDTEYKAENAFNSCVGVYFNYSNDYSVTWYTDKDCTTAVDWTDKKADYLNDKTFYGKMTIEEGKAVVLNEITWKDSRSEAYKIVFGEAGGYSYISNVQGLTVDTDVANNKHEFEDRDGFSDFLVIYVNGVAQAETATDFTYEAGKMYIVSYCNEYTDSKMNIFKMY